MIFNLDQLKKAFDYADEEEDEDGNIVKRVFLGTVFGLIPSGKYYMPFALGNVTEKEVEADEEWYEQAEQELDKIGAYMISDETDPCDLIAIMLVEEAE